MIDNGWYFDFTHDGTNPSGKYVSVGQNCIGAKWYGWSADSQVGALTAMLQGWGEVTLEYGNCWNQGSVNVYLDGALESTATAGIKDKTVTFAFTSGSILSIKDEDGNSVVMLKAITFSCTGMLI